MQTRLSRRVLIILPLIISVFMPSCTPEKKATSTQPPLVAVSIPPLEYFVREIGGEDVRLICLAPSGADPETFEPSVATLRNASEASLFIIVGLLPFEEKITQTLANENPAIQDLQLAHSIDVILGTHGEDEADPHIWGSYRNARRMAEATLGALIKIRPDAASAFRQRFQVLDARLDSLDKITANRLLPLQGKSFLIWHPSLSYFARDYNLNQISVSHEHKESSATDLRKRLVEVSSRKPLVFFYQKELDSRQSQTITDATGLRPVTLNPLSPDIEDTLEKVTQALTPNEK